MFRSSLQWTSSGHFVKKEVMWENQCASYIEQYGKKNIWRILRLPYWQTSQTVIFLADISLIISSENWQWECQRRWFVASGYLLVRKSELTFFLESVLYINGGSGATAGARLHHMVKEKCEAFMMTRLSERAGCMFMFVICSLRFDGSYRCGVLSKDTIINSAWRNLRRYQMSCQPKATISAAPLSLFFAVEMCMGLLIKYDLFIY